MLTIQTLQRHQWRRSGVFNINFEHIRTLASVFYVDFEQLNVRWVVNETCQQSIFFL